MRSFILAALLVVNAAFADGEVVGFAAFENGDYTTAYPYLMQAARDGNIEAMYLLGRMFQYGQGVSKIPKKRSSGIKICRKIIL